MFKTFTLLVLSGSLFLCGCAKSVPFSPANRASAHGASVAKRSQYPERGQVMILTAGQNIGMALGGAIAVAAHEAAGDDRSQFAAFLKGNRIDAGLIVAGSFEEELRKAPLWPHSSSNGEAVFEFKVEKIGLLIRHGFTARLSPYLSVEGKLVRRDGTVLWQRTTYVRDGEVRHSFEEYFQQPDVLRAALEAASRRLSREFLREMHVQSGGRDPISAEDRAEEDARDAQEEARERDEDAAHEVQKREKQAAKKRQSQGF